MNRLHKYWIAYITITRKEVLRFGRIWVQTIIPPVITVALYFVIFGNLIGERIGHMDGMKYIDFIMPGLIMMSIITSSYANVVSSFYGAKFSRHIEEMLVSPIPNTVILLGFLTGGVARGISVGPLDTKIEGMDIQIAQLNDKLKKCVIKSPIEGTILVKYAEEN